MNESMNVFFLTQCFVSDLKKSYVDILGNSGQTVSQPKDLAPQMDMQFFNPMQQQQQVSLLGIRDQLNSTLTHCLFTGNAVL